MPAIYICSTEAGAGKTTLALGLAGILANSERKIGYYKPYSQTKPDPDTVLAKQTLNLASSPDDISPFLGDEPLTEIVSVADRVASGCAGLLVEGFAKGASAPSAASVAQTLGAKVLLVVRYSGEGTTGDILTARQAFGDEFLGVVINDIPAAQDSFVRQNIIPSLPTRRIKVLGIIPQKRTLLAATPLELAKGVGGEIVAENGAIGTLVENILIGAVSYEGVSRYMARKEQKAVITGANRPDIALAALATPTVCLILTGGYPIDPTVLANARSRGVAVILTQDDTQATLERMQNIFGHTPLKPGNQISIIEDLVRQSVDIAPITTALGLD
jgi:uncharacterized protein